jgi:cell division protein FtsI/penicillin-binding protein 2
MNELSRREFIIGLIASLGLANIPSNILAQSSLFYWCNIGNGLVEGTQLKNIPKSCIGSITKLIAAALILEENILSINKTFECKQKIQINGKEYTCQKSHGKLSLADAICYSCNMYFAQVASLIPINLFFKYLKTFGFNQSVADINNYLYTEQTQGNIQDYILGLNTNIQPNLLHTLQLSSIIAQSGNYQTLHFMGKPSTQKHINFSAHTWQFLQTSMRMASRIGTGKKIDEEDKLLISLKTGTFPNKNNFESLVTGYFPSNNPKYAFCLKSFNGTSQNKAIPAAHKELFSRKWV